MLKLTKYMLPALSKSDLSGNTYVARIWWLEEMAIAESGFLRRLDRPTVPGRHRRVVAGCARGCEALHRVNRDVQHCTAFLRRQKSWYRQRQHQRSSDEFVLMHIPFYHRTGAPRSVRSATPLA